MKKIFIFIAIIFALVVPAYAATLPTLSACSSFAATDIFLARHSTDTTDCKATGTQLKSGLSLNNVENTALSTWAGTANITTLGTITTGTWNASDLAYAYLTQGSALSVLGVTGNATADVASIAAGSDHQVLRRSGTALAFGAVNLAQSAAVTGSLPIANGGTAGTTKATAHSGLGLKQEYCYAGSDFNTTALTAATDVAIEYLPAAFTVTAVRAYVRTAPSGLLTIDINEANTSILSTKLTIDSGEKTSGTAATAAVISDSSIAANAEIDMDIDSTTAGKGLVICLEGTF